MRIDSQEMLDTLAQIQACVGELSMERRARETEEARTHLEMALPALRKAAEEDREKMRGRA